MFVSVIVNVTLLPTLGVALLTVFVIDKSATPGVIVNCAGTEV